MHIDYEPLPSVTDTGSAAQPGGPAQPRVSGLSGSSSLLAQAESGGHTGLIILFVGGILFVGFVLAMLFAARYTKVGPNEVLIISGRTHRVSDGRGGEKEVGFRIKKGGGTFDTLQGSPLAR